MGRYSNNSTSEPAFRHLTIEDRIMIEAGIKYGATKQEIAEGIGFNASSVYREAKRGSCIQTIGGKDRVVYLADLGQLRSDEARANSVGKSKLECASEFVSEVGRRMCEMRGLGVKVGPDGFVGELTASGAYDVSEAVCTKTVYKYIYNGDLRTKTTDLPLKPRLRRKKGKGTAQPRENKRVFGSSIDERPAEAESREEFGDWECDLVMGKKGAGGGALFVAAERKTRYYAVTKIESASAASAEAAFMGLVNEYGAQVFKSCTFDNGSEFSGMAGLCEGLGIKAYFTHPYCAWEKGKNGSLRLATPKGTPIKGLCESTISGAEMAINSLPRKIHGYRPSEELFEEGLDKLYAAL